MSSLQKQNKKDSTIQFRVNLEDKSTIQHAAELRGMEPSVYIRSLVLERARKDINDSGENSRIVLSTEEWEQFMNVMNSPIKINKHLKKILADFKKKYG